MATSSFYSGISYTKAEAALDPDTSSSLHGSINKYQWSLKAISDYKASLAIEDVQDILSGGSLQSILQQVNQAKGERVQGRSKIVTTLLDGLSTFANWVDRYPTNSEPRRTLKKVVNVFTRIGENVDRFTLYQGLFPQSPRKWALALIYADIIAFCCKATILYRTKGFFASALTRFEQDFESLVQRSERHKELVEDEVQAAEIGQSHKVRTEHETERKRDKIKAIWKWLPPSTQEATYYQNDHHAAKARRTSGTCDWVYKSRTYCNWQESISFTLIFTGNSGCGKTILASSVVDDLILRFGRESVAYFYCKYQDNDKKISLSIVKSLLLQLVDSCALGQDIFQDLEKLYGSSVQETARDSGYFRPFWNLLCRISQRATRQNFVVVDALDECEDRDVFLQAITTNSAGIVGSVPKVLILSRPEPDIMEVDTTKGNVHIRPLTRNDTAADMVLYVSASVASVPKLRCLPSYLQQKIE
ncbi:MAG: hypothetical protein M1830_000398 [Pleopsidium flavum]|nr:MAG: hypothetical protein M1830_000398 [Pleopsidium flavum]